MLGELGRRTVAHDLVDADTGSPQAALRATAVPPGTYFIRVRGRSSGGTSAPSNEVVVTVAGACTHPPFGPTGLAASVSGSSVSLTWQSPGGDCEPTSYVLEAGSASGLSNLVSFSTGTTATTYSATGVAAGTYFVRIRAANGALTSAASNEIQVTIGGCTGPPGSVSNYALWVDGTTVWLTWPVSPGSPTSYVIEAGSSPGRSNLAVIDTGDTATIFNATAPAGTYYVRLRGKNGCGLSFPSVDIVVTVSGTAPSSPTWAAEGARMTDISAGLPGGFANPSAFQLRDGRWRLLFSAGGGIRSWTSSDGLTFTLESGIRIANPGTDCGHGRAFRLDDTRIRVYCRNALGIVSVISTDEGLTFTSEGGLLISNASVGASRLSTGGVVRTRDGRWRMYFSDEFASSFTPTRIFSAVSSDLVTWTVDTGVRIGAGATASGTATHPSAITNPDGSVSVFYTRFGLGTAADHVPDGVWVATSSDGLTFTSDNFTGLTPGADPDVVARPDGGYRLYYNWGDSDHGTLYSARSR